MSVLGTCGEGAFSFPFVTEYGLQLYRPGSIREKNLKRSPILWSRENTYHLGLCQNLLILLQVGQNELQVLLNGEICTHNVRSPVDHNEIEKKEKITSKRPHPHSVYAPWLQTHRETPSTGNDSSSRRAQTDKQTGPFSNLIRPSWFLPLMLI